jgi:Zn-dependent peptidase ImmA (M78 family)
VDGQVIRIGDPTGLHFALRWDAEHPTGNAADATDGTLLAQIADHVVWGSPTDEGAGIGWSWVELLEHLAENWIRLVLEELPPLDIDDASDPVLLRSEMEHRWLQVPRAQVEREQAELWAFERAHDLASAFEGGWPTSFWLVRQGLFIWLVSGDYRIQRPADTVVATLSALGNCIAERLRALQDARANKAIAAWNSRTARTAPELISYSTGLSKDVIAAVAGTRPLDGVWGLTTTAPEPNELLAAARMAGPGLTSQSIRKIIDRIRTIRPGANAALESLSAMADDLARSDPSGEPFEPGVTSASGRVDPEAILRNWDVRLLELDLQDSSIDAVCCWGPRHGPAVLLNPSGRHAKDDGARRATLAHEIAHLLLDRKGALPLAEVNGGRVPARTEARARAFAAELLLPRRIAGEAFAGTKDTDAAVQRLCRRFGVSKELVAWQARNSMQPLNARTFQRLKEFVAEPWRFIPVA